MSALFPAGRNRLIEGDCLAVMRRLPAATVDLIYVDPPFFSGRDRTLSDRRSAAAAIPAATDGQHGAAPTGGPAPAGPGAAFADRWPGGLADYLGWLTPRLREMHRLLGPTGSLFVHLDWHAVHYVKCMLDEIFGSLDEDRRIAVVELLRSLADRFPQVILITHIDSVREGFDRVVRVGYDLARGVSVVRDDEPTGAHDVAA